MPSVSFIVYLFALLIAVECSSLQLRNNRECVDDDDCEYGKKCYDQECKCPFSNRGSNCAKLNDYECQQNLRKCYESGGACEYERDRSISCKCDGMQLDSEAKECYPSEEECADELPFCGITGGQCRTYTKSRHMYCKCPPDTFTYKLPREQICEVSSEKCMELYPLCRKSGGSCESTKNGIICNCSSGLTAAIEKDRCIVDREKCIEKIPLCILSGGSCTPTENGFICSCSDGLTAAPEKDRCIVDREKCMENIPLCVESGGSCKPTKNGFICSCSDGLTTAPEKDRCIVDREKCIEKIPLCMESGGSCKPTKNGFICSCSDGLTTAPEKDKCIVSEEQCAKKLPKCMETGGECKTLGGVNLMYCKCPPETFTFNPPLEQACQVKWFECMKMYPFCMKSGGSCESTKNGIICSCSGGLTTAPEKDRCIDHECDDDADCDYGNKCYDHVCKCPFPDRGSQCAKLNEYECHQNLRNCYESRGTCEYERDRSISCKCDGMELDTEAKECYLSEDVCTDELPHCVITGGQCQSWKGSKTIFYCKCPSNTFTHNLPLEQVCEVGAYMCRKLYPFCMESGGSCESTKNGIICTCPQKLGLTTAPEKDRCIYDSNKLNCSYSEIPCVFKCCPRGSACILSLGICKGGNSQNIENFDTTENNRPSAAALVDAILGRLPPENCPSDTTQCRLGCCPIPSGVCCSNGVHCCPSGSTCNDDMGGCVRNGMYSPFVDNVGFLQDQ